MFQKNSIFVTEIKTLYFVEFVKTTLWVNYADLWSNKRPKDHSKRIEVCIQNLLIECMSKST